MRATTCRNPDLGVYLYNDKSSVNKLTSHKGVVLEAVRQNGQSLQYASEALREDKEVSPPFKDIRVLPLKA